MSTPSSLSTNVIFLCGEMSHIFHRSLTSVFAAKNVRVTVEQFSILALLFYQEGISQQEISVRLNRNKATITRVISNMERSKMIVRVTNKEDSRGKLIFLTQKGKSIQAQAIKLSGEMYLKAMSGIKENDIAKAIQVLNKIINNVK